VTDAVLRRVARLLRRAQAPADDREGEGARRELERLRRGGLHADPLPGEWANMAAMVVREGVGCEVVRVGDALWLVGSERQISDARVASALLHDEWRAAWERSQRETPRLPIEANIGGVTVRMHFQGFSPEMVAALFGPQRPRDREAFVTGLAQGAFLRVVEQRRRQGHPQRPPSLLVREELAEAEVKARRVNEENDYARRQAGGAGAAAGAGSRAESDRGGPTAGAPREPQRVHDLAADQAAARAAAEAARRRAEAEASMRAGREASYCVRSGGITLRLREMPPALPPHVP
jgi:hypothetical protein